MQVDEIYYSDALLIPNNNLNIQAKIFGLFITTIFIYVPPFLASFYQQDSYYYKKRRNYKKNKAIGEKAKADCPQKKKHSRKNAYSAIPVSSPHSSLPLKINKVITEFQLPSLITYYILFR